MATRHVIVSLIAISVLLCPLVCSAEAGAVAKEPASPASHEGETPCGGHACFCTTGVIERAAPDVDGLGAAWPNGNAATASTDDAADASGVSSARSIGQRKPGMPNTPIIAAVRPLLV